MESCNELNDCMCNGLICLSYSIPTGGYKSGFESSDEQVQIPRCQICKLTSKTQALSIK